MRSRYLRTFFIFFVLAIALLLGGKCFVSGMSPGIVRVVRWAAIAFSALALGSACFAFFVKITQKELFEAAGLKNYEPYDLRKNPENSETFFVDHPVDAKADDILDRLRFAWVSGNGKEIHSELPIALVEVDVSTRTRAAEVRFHFREADDDSRNAPLAMSFRSDPNWFIAAGDKAGFTGATISINPRELGDEKFLKELVTAREALRATKKK